MSSGMRWCSRRVTRSLFRCGNETKEGVVCIVDVHGTFEQPDILSYDILVDEENMLYKHVECEMIVNEE